MLQHLSLISRPRPVWVPGKGKATGVTLTILPNEYPLLVKYGCLHHVPITWTGVERVLCLLLSDGGSLTAAVVRFLETSMALYNYTGFYDLYGIRIPEAITERLAYLSRQDREGIYE